MNDRTRKTLIFGGIIAILLIIFGAKTFITIRSGEKGVIYSPFAGGVQKDKVYDQGLKVIMPWNTMFKYNVREQQIEEAMDVLSSNGLNISVDVSIRFHPDYTKVGYLHDQFGKNYIQELVKPEIRSVVREIIGRYTPEELYSTKREEVQKSIFDEAARVLGENYIEVDALLMRSVKLPERIKEAISKKLEQEQIALQYEFRLETERKEADRKRIEAEGINDFQKIVTKGISDKLLKWKGIEATEKLAESPNSKVIVIGNGEGDLPIILGGDN